MSHGADRKKVPIKTGRVLHAGSRTTADENRSHRRKQKKQCDYRDLGSDYFDRLNADGLKRYLSEDLKLWATRSQSNRQHKRGE
jgi:hypothetical protein